MTPASSDTENNEEVLVITSLTSEQTAADEDVADANANPQGGTREDADASDGEGSEEMPQPMVTLLPTPLVPGSR